VPADAVVRHVVVFGRVLREAGLEVGPGRVADALTGLDAIELDRQDDVYWTLRQTLVSRREDLDAFDRAFKAWFLRGPIAPEERTHELPPGHDSGLRGQTKSLGSALDGNEVEAGGWSEREVLRTKDFGDMTPEESKQARRLIQRLAVARPLRHSRRMERDSRGTVLDVRGLVRRSLATGGDPVARAFRSRKHIPRKLILLLDVSGSMESYARALLLYLHAARGSGRGVETFAFGTRLTRLTRELGTRDPDAALRAASHRVVDWAGGTRIGASLKAFNDEWGRRALTRGAVVVILSDGLERGEPELVDHEMARLARQAFAVVWVNPLKGDAAYEPLAAGMRAALPHIDRLVAGHDVASLEGLGRVLGGIERRHAA
jgi:uncharacterized protein with von Willebrand factor type A (vWA) domain